MGLLRSTVRRWASDGLDQRETVRRCAVVKGVDEDGTEEH